MSLSVCDWVRVLCFHLAQFVSSESVNAVAAHLLSAYCVQNINILLCSSFVKLCVSVTTTMPVWLSFRWPMSLMLNGAHTYLKTGYFNMFRLWSFRINLCHREISSKCFFFFSFGLFFHKAFNENMKSQRNEREQQLEINYVHDTDFFYTDLCIHFFLFCHNLLIRFDSISLELLL